MKNRDDIRIIHLIVLAILVSVVVLVSSSMAGSSPPLNDPRDRLVGSSPPLNGARIELFRTTPPTLEGCLKCHDKIEPMHRYGPTVAGALDKLDNGKDGLGLTCSACHGGNPVTTTKEEAHVQPRFPREWMRDGRFRVPENSGPLLARESAEFVRFINPGDFRVATKTCGSSECHTSETTNATRSMMTHGAMLWGAALYNNGGFPIKDTNFGESYSVNGAPQTVI